MVQSIEDSSLQNISNQIIEEEVKFKFYILYFLFCFTGKQFMKMPMKVCIKWQRIIGTPSRMRSRMSTPLRVLFWEKIIFDFIQKCNIIFVTFMHVYIKYHISIFFLRMIIFYFLSKETIYFLVKKYHLSR